MEIIDVGEPEKKRKPPSAKELFINHYLAKQLIKCLRWQEMLKESEKSFVVKDGARKAKRAKFDDSDSRKSDGGDASAVAVDSNTIAADTHAIAIPDWRSQGALTQDEKANLHSDLKCFMKDLSAIDNVLNEFVKGKTDEVVT
uniref:Uncharacterized protein n=1 Tax=Tetranychus urticae TaxID=32264 RepID=T1KWX2_TETUR